MPATLARRHCCLAPARTVVRWQHCPRFSSVLRRLRCGGAVTTPAQLEPGKQGGKKIRNSIECGDGNGTATSGHAVDMRTGLHGGAGQAKHDDWYSLGTQGLRLLQTCEKWHWHTCCSSVWSLRCLSASSCVCMFPRRASITASASPANEFSVTYTTIMDYTCGFVTLLLPHMGFMTVCVLTACEWPAPV